MRRVVLANLRSNPLRLASTALAIILGIAFITGTLVLTDTMNAAFRSVFGDVNAGVDVSVRATAGFDDTFGGPQRAGIDPALVTQIEAVEAVAAVEAVFSGPVQFLDPSGAPVGQNGPPPIGQDVPDVGELSAIEVRDGRFPATAGEVAVDQNSARRQGLAVGDRLGMAVGGTGRELTVVGLLGYEGIEDAGGAGFAVFDEATARAAYGGQGASALNVLADSGVDREDLRADVATALGGEYDVVTGEQLAAEGLAAAGTFLTFLTAGLLVFAGVSLFVGAFLIFNTFSITVAQRTRELALLRAVGAGRAQVLRAVLGEALITGVVGAAAGIGLGVAVAAGLRGLLELFGLSLPSTALVFAWRTPVIAAVLGLVVTVVAAVAPALRATRIAPVAALQSVAAPPVRGFSAARLGAGSAVAAAGAGLLALGLFGSAGLAATGAGALVVLLAMAVLSPLSVRPVVGVLGAPLAAVRGLSGTLARENALRNPRRTAATAAALMIGLGLITFTLIFTQSLRASVDQTLEQRFLADLQIQGVGPDAGLPPEVAEAVAAVPGVEVVSPTKTGTIGVDGVAREAVAIDPATVERVLAIEVVDGSLAGLAGDGVALTDELAAGLGVGVGGTVPVTFAPGGPVEDLPVAATFDAASLGFGPGTGQVLLSTQVFEAAFPGRPDYSLLLATTDSARPAVEDALAAYPAALVQDDAEVAAEVAAQTDRILGLFTALLLFSVVIALFGIVNTLGLSVLERTREIGLLRAVGMLRAQVRTMVRWEAVLVAVLGAVLGLAVGTFFAWIMVTALAGSGLSVLALPTVQLGLALAGAAVAGVLAAVVPARRAARIDVLRALQTS
jgi:putative ABC transport system permease protein